MPCMGLDVQGNGGKAREDQGAALLGVDTQKGAASPPRPLSLGDWIWPWGMCSCLCRGLAPGTPLGPPTPEAGTEHPTLELLKRSPTA